ncbi:DUF4307 domain-containing protein [Arthrobacter bambusae]|uniref:DUF4307 domain-containing protein n=1 Tax=Arthrobacter bambusae TaxID=1338426 RepID=UPI00277FA2BF|nr:DUF4307 domain-containing protein [Arthrobacter bambusae]MDQ0029282.1 hypothetical protein [Arthrobacter bambusae]MDQ0098191.1 hypothetical protein [Arthrobacter bambusae]
MTSEDPSATALPATTSLANRYGSQKRAFGGKTKRNVLIAVLLVVVALLFWVTTSSSQSSVSFKDIGYSATDATQLAVDFQVTKNPDATAKCAVKAMDSGFGVVGWKVVQIGPNDPKDGADGGRTTAQRTILRTESAAVSAVVDNCWIVDSNK